MKRRRSAVASGAQPRLPLPAPGTSPIWRCPNCGQRCFGDPPPDRCAYCDDFTTWQPIPDAASDDDGRPAPNSSG